MSIDAQAALETASGTAGITAANLWERYGKTRIYLDVPKLNGGAGWNGGRGVSAWIDCDSDELVVRANSWAGSRTAKAGTPILQSLADALGLAYREEA